MKRNEKTQRLLAGAVAAVVLTGLGLFTVQVLIALRGPMDPVLVASLVYAVPFILVPWCAIGMFYLAIALLSHGPLRAAIAQYGFWLPLAIGVPATAIGVLSLSDGGAALLVLGIPPLALAAGLWLLGRMTPPDVKPLTERRQALDELVRLRDEGLITAEEFKAKVTKFNVATQERITSSSW